MRGRIGMIVVIGLTAACAAGSARFLSGCSAALRTTVQEALVDAGIIATIPSPENSPSAVRGHEGIVVGYTDLRGGAFSPAGWAWSAVIPPTSASWQKCNMTIFDPNCGSVPTMAVSSTGQTQGSWLGPASLATDQINILYATLAGDTLTPSSPTLVVVTLSTDGGRSFGQARSPARSSTRPAVAAMAACKIFRTLPTISPHPHPRFGWCGDTRRARPSEDVSGAARS